MSAKNSGWPVKAEAPPKLVDRQWVYFGLIGALFILMAILQIFSFDDFTYNLASLNINSAKYWAGLLVLAELWAAACFFKIRLSYGFRMVSRFWAVAVVLFWFCASVKAASEGFVPSNFFGRFLSQQAGWWPVLESAVVLFIVLAALEVSESKSKLTSRRA